MGPRQVLNIYSYSELYEDGNWVVKSDDLPELLLVGKDHDMLLRDIPKVIKLLLENNYKLSEVSFRWACFFPT